MRKAVVAAATGARRNNRRGSNKQDDGPSAAAAAPATKLKQVSPDKTQHQQKQKQQQAPKIKMSAEEAALTAKNYRLAKELVGLSLGFAFVCHSVDS